MSFKKWLGLVAAGAFVIGAQNVVAQGHGNGHGKSARDEYREDRHEAKHEARHEAKEERHYYREHDREERSAASGARAPISGSRNLAAGPAWVYASMPDRSCPLSATSAGGLHAHGDWRKHCSGEQEQFLRGGCFSLRTVEKQLLVVGY